MEAKRDAAVVLGGSFFCSRSSGWAAQRDIRCVVSTLVQILALESSEYQQVLVEHIDSGIQYKEAAVQVEQLLHMPLLAQRLGASLYGVKQDCLNAARTHLHTGRPTAKEARLLS